jgi:hypothetical protein
MRSNVALWASVWGFVHGMAAGVLASQIIFGCWW